MTLAAVCELRRRLNATIASSIADVLHRISEPLLEQSGKSGDERMVEWMLAEAAPEVGARGGFE